jgi:hypothetical protein
MTVMEAGTKTVILLGVLPFCYYLGRTTEESQGGGAKHFFTSQSFYHYFPLPTAGEDQGEGKGER